MKARHFEKSGGYFKTGLRKNEAARAVGAGMNPRLNRSRSFANFYDAIVEAASL